MEYAPALRSRKKPTLEKVCKRFETWRRTKKPASRIPNGLWKAAEEICVQYPVRHVAKELGLNYTELTKRVTAAGLKAAERSPVPAGFVELDLGVPAEPVACTVELENAAGEKLRMRFSAAFDPLEWAREFWRRGS
jgi:hypothetical protein